MGKTILVIRFSALGDVALTVPVLKHLSFFNPDTRFIVVSDSRWADLFIGIERVSFQGFDLKKNYAGLSGIIRIFWFLLKSYQFKAVADLHGVIRSHILSMLFFVSGKQIASINKGRSEKANLTRKNHKQLFQIPHTTERYLKVFEQLGLSVNLQQFTNEMIKVKKVASVTKKIGFAPFAKHVLKMYPLEKMEQVVRYFDKEGYEMYFFGKGNRERTTIDDWNKKYKHAVSIPDAATLKDELKIISALDLLVTMDSANMHLASNANIPVLSMWGPTHPVAGFYGFRQDPSNAVQLDLSCRPCSVYGNNPCWRGDHACMQEIHPAFIVSKIEEMIH